MPFELVSGPTADLTLELVELRYSDEAGYHVVQSYTALRDCLIDGHALSKGERASKLLFAEVPVHVVGEFPWEEIWRQCAPHTRLTAADRTLFLELEVFVERQASALRRRLGKGLVDLLLPVQDRDLDPRLGPLVQLPDGVVRTPSLFGEPIRVPRVQGTRTHVQVTFPLAVTAVLPVIDGRMVTLTPFDLSVYAVCCQKWEVARSLEPDTAPEHLVVGYAPSEVLLWLGLDPDSGGNLQLAKESMHRLGAITFDVPRYSAREGDYRSQFQLLERHDYDPEGRWGRFELPSPIVAELVGGRRTTFNRDVLNQLRKVSATAVFLYAYLETHRGWEGHESGLREIRIGMEKLRESINRRDTNASRVRKDVMRAVQAIEALDAGYTNGSLTKGRGGDWVFRVLKVPPDEARPPGQVRELVQEIAAKWTPNSGRSRRATGP